VLKIAKINHKDCNFDVLMNNPPNQEYSSRKKRKDIDGFSVTWGWN
jgi:hypothetical protein